MASKDVIEMVREHLLPIADENGLDIYDMEFLKEGPNWYFRIYIEKKAADTEAGGVGIDDCELISRAAEKFLDEKDPIPQAYMLEVSSPGLDRPLKKDADYARYTGFAVDVKLYKAHEGRKVWEGVLSAFGKDTITIDAEGNPQEFNRENVASCRLAVSL